MQYFGADCFMGTGERFINYYKTPHHILSSPLKPLAFDIYLYIMTDINVTVRGVPKQRSHKEKRKR